MVEGFRDVLTERVAGTTRRDAPATPVVRVRPQQVAHRTLVGDLLDSVERPNVIEGINAGGETAVEAEDLVVDEGSEGEVVEEVGEVLPDVGVAVFPEALVVEAVDLSDLTRLMVAAEDGDALWVSDLEGNEKGHRLHGVVTTVDVVACCSWSACICEVPKEERVLTHEEVVGIWVWTTDLEQLHQVVELTMDITAHRHRAFLLQLVSMLVERRGEGTWCENVRLVGH